MDVPDLPANGVTQVQIIGDSVGPARHALCGTQRLSAGCGIASAPGGSDVAIGIEMSNAAPLAVWVGSMRPKTQRESLGGSCCWSCPDHPDYSERPMRAG